MTLQVEASMPQHVEGHFLYSVNYMHFGKPKGWYGVPSCETINLEESTRKKLLKLFEEYPDLLHELVTIFQLCGWPLISLYICSKYLLPSLALFWSGIP
jgi:hypothetical protein